MFTRCIFCHRPFEANEEVEHFPVGRRIAFDRTDYERDRRAILVLDLATGTETEVAHSDGDFVFEPSWQPRA